MLVTLGLSVVSTTPSHADEPTTKVTFVEKDARAEGGKKAGPLASGAEVVATQRIATGPGSRAGLQFPGGGNAVIAHDSMVRVRDGTTSPSKAPVDVTLMAGGLTASSGAGKAVVVGSSVSFAFITIDAGDALVTVDDKGTTRVSVSKGSADLAAWKRNTPIPAGFGAKVEKGYPPSPAVALPAAPTWKRAPEAYAWSAGADGAEVSAEYAGSSGSKPAQWHVQFARDAAFTSILREELVPGETTTFVGKHLPVGSYFLRVSAIDSDTFEGPFSAPASASVIEAVWQLVPGHMAVGEIRPRPPELQCGMDDAPLEPVKGPVRVEAWGNHELRCKPTKDSSLARLPVIKDNLGKLGLTAKWLEQNLDQKTGEIVIRLTDEAGEQLSTRSMKVTSDTPGVDVTFTDPGLERGRYFVKVRWTQDRPAFRLKGTLGDSVATSNVLSVREGAPPPPPTDWYSLALGAGAGLVAPATDSPIFGARVSVHGSYWTPFGPGSAGVGLRATFEEYFSADAQVTEPRKPESAGLKVDHQVISLSLPFAYRLGASQAGHRPLLAPYVLVEPIVGFQNVSATRPIDGTRRSGNGLLGVGAGLGVDLRSGEGDGFWFLEADVRTLGALGVAKDVVQDGGYFGTIGYRFGSY